MSKEKLNEDGLLSDSYLKMLEQEVPMMKRTVMKVLALCCILALYLTGCGAQSTVTGKPFDVEGAEYYLKLANGWFHEFEFDFQDDVQGMILAQEVWQNGVCTDEQIITYGGTGGKQSYYLYSEKLQDEEKEPDFIGTTLSIWAVSEIDGGGQLGSKFAPLERRFPQVVTMEYYDAISKEQTLEAGKEYVLFLQMEQFGDEVLAATCDDLNRALAEGNGLDELLHNCSYAIILKMSTFATEAEAEASGQTK